MDLSRLLAEKVVQSEFQDLPLEVVSSVKKGIIVAGGGLARKSTYLRLAGGKMTVSDGPFIESKEFIPGFTMIQVSSREEALEWATGLRKIIGDGEFRITQVFGPT